MEDKYICTYCGSIGEIEEKKRQEEELRQKFNKRVENGYTFVDLGKFPQTHVNNIDLIDKLNQLSSTNSNGYYEYSGNEYAKIKADLFKYQDQYDKYSDNTKVLNETAWFKVEPIKWRVLETNGNKLTLVSEYLLKAMKFHSSSNNYNSSDIRNWLLNVFYNKAFNNEEKSIIISNTSVNNDKVWLLSKEEVKNKKYFKNNTAREGELTDYALATHAYLSSVDFAGDWWLRSPDSDYSDYEYDIWTDGSVSFNYVTYAYLCTRPSLIIEIE